MSDARSATADAKTDAAWCLEVFLARKADDAERVGLALMAMPDELHRAFGSADGLRIAQGFFIVVDLLASAAVGQVDHDRETELLNGLLFVLEGLAAEAVPAD